MPKDSAKARSQSKSERAGLKIPSSRAARISSGVIGKNGKKSKKPNTRVGGNYSIMMAAAIEEAMDSLIDQMKATGDK